MEHIDDVCRSLKEFIKREAESKYFRDTLHEQQIKCLEQSNLVTEIINEVTEQSRDLVDRSRDKVTKILCPLPQGRGLSWSGWDEFLQIYTAHMSYNQKWGKFSSDVNFTRELADGVDVEWERIVPTPNALSNLTMEEWKNKSRKLRDIELAFRFLKSVFEHLKLEWNEVKESWHEKLEEFVQRAAVFADKVKKEPLPPPPLGGFTFSSG